MARLLYVLPDVAPDVMVRLDTAEETDTPAEIANSLGNVIPGSKLQASDTGTLPRVYGPAAGTTPLWLKTLDGDGEVTGDPVEVAGVELGAGPGPTAVLRSADVNVPDVLDENSGTTNVVDGPNDYFISFARSGNANPEVLLRPDELRFADGTEAPGDSDGYLWYDRASGVFEFGDGVAATGKITASDDIECTGAGDGFVLKSPDGTRYRIRVANGGALSAEAVV